jgi:hypothetical protein
MTIVKNSNRTASICKLFYVYKEEICIMNFGSDVFHLVVTLKNNYTWKEIYFTPGSAEFTEVQKEEIPGQSYQQKLRFLFPGEDEANLSDLDPVITRPVVIRMDYGNGKSKLMGGIGNPARVNKSHKSDSKYTGTELTASCVDRCQAFFYEE